MVLKSLRVARCKGSLSPCSKRITHPFMLVLLLFGILALSTFSFAKSMTVFDDGNDKIDVEIEQRTEGVFKKERFIQSESCYSNLTAVSKKTCVPSLDYTYNVFDYAKVHNVTTGKVHYALVGGVDVSGKSTYFNGVLSVFSVPLGSRNLALFPKCRPYEIEKGVCREVVIS